MLPSCRVSVCVLTVCIFLFLDDALLHHLGTKLCLEEVEAKRTQPTEPETEPADKGTAAGARGAETVPSLMPLHLCVVS